ncbi:MAG: hypothetical protein HY790_04235 [Deltaproteobacteria bacterium]|nr:hypothetical protein [Deltaproteobacteria bacterium]
MEKKGMPQLIQVKIRASGQIKYHEGIQDIRRKMAIAVKKRGICSME